MGPFLRSATALGALALAGCTVNHYRVAMTPVPEGLRRELTCWRGEDYGTGVVHEMPFPADRIARAARAYGKPTPEPGNGRHAFEGIFPESMPDDVGGTGMLVRTPTSLGVIWRYVERFRGDPDPAADLERRFRAADRIGKILVAWGDAELSNAPGWDRLRTFLAGPFRRDLKNLVLLGLSQPERSSGTGRPKEGLAAFLLFAVERGYLLPAEVPVLDDGPKDRKDLLLRRMIARRMGVADTDPIPEALGFLADDRVEASLERLGAASPVVARLWKERAAESPDPGLPEKVDAGLLLGLLAMYDLLDMRLFEDQDRLEVSVACGVEPMETNGEWRQAEGRVVWPETPLRDRGSSGLLRHAMWAAPNEAFQRARFGKVVLVGQALADYVAWRARLAPAQGDAWDRALAALTPDADVAASLRGLGRMPDAGGKDLSEEGRTILQKAIAGAK